MGLGMEAKEFPWGALVFGATKYGIAPLAKVEMRLCGIVWLGNGWHVRGSMIVVLTRRGLRRIEDVSRGECAVAGEVERRGVEVDRAVPDAYIHLGIRSVKLRRIDVRLHLVRSEGTVCRHDGRRLVIRVVVAQY